MTDDKEDAKTKIASLESLGDIGQRTFERLQRTDDKEKRRIITEIQWDDRASSGGLLSDEVKWDDLEPAPEHTDAEYDALNMRIKELENIVQFTESRVTKSEKERDELKAEVERLKKERNKALEILGSDVDILYEEDIAWGVKPLKKEPKP